MTNSIRIFCDYATYFHFHTNPITQLMDQTHKALILDITNKGGQWWQRVGNGFYWLLVIIVCIMTIRLSTLSELKMSEEKMGRSVWLSVDTCGTFFHDVVAELEGQNIVHILDVRTGTFSTPVGSQCIQGTSIGIKGDVRWMKIHQIGKTQLHFLITGILVDLSRCHVFNVKIAKNTELKQSL